MKHFLVTVLLYLNSLVGISQDNLYQYPVRPDMPGWKSLSTAQERLNACDIPQSYLEKASTTDLLITCLNHPLLFEIAASNNLLIGMENLCLHIKAFQTLRQRADYKQVLFDYYRSTNPQSIIYITDDMGKFKYSSQYLYMELLLANKKFVQSLTALERKALAQQLLIKFEAKNQLADSYKYFGTVGSLLGLAQILSIDSQNNKSGQTTALDVSKINQLLDNHIGYNKDTGTYILQESYNFTK